MWYSGFRYFLLNNAILIFFIFQSMVVEPAPRLSMRRPNTLLLRDGKTEFFLAFESKEERTLWMDTINQVY